MKVKLNFKRKERKINMSALNIKSNLSEVTLNSKQIIQTVGDFTNISSVSGAENDNTSVQTTCTSLYSDGRNTLSNYRELAHRDGEYIRNVGISFDDVDKLLKQTMSFEGTVRE